MDTTDIDLTDLDGWIGRREEDEDICALPLVRRVAALLDRDPLAYKEGDALPAGWQMCLFTPLTATEGLKADGHAAHDPLMPPVPLPRRMLGGRRLTYHEPVVIGDRLKRVGEVVRIEPKTGRSGQLIVVTVRHSIFRDGAGTPAIVEEQDSIFREEAPPGGAAKPAPAGKAPPGKPDFDAERTPDTRLLFRYSAICFNTHRIHYDQAYATEDEGYPDLIVNGGLTALLLVDLLERNTGRQPRRLTARNTGAVICGRPIRLCGMTTPEGWTLWVQDRDANVLLEAQAT